MLERIANALEIDAPALFSTKTYPFPTDGTMTKFQEQVMNDIAQVISFRVMELNYEIDQKMTSGAFYRKSADNQPQK